MAKYLLRRLLHGVFSIIAVVAIVMILIYSLMDRETVFDADNTYVHTASNQREVYKYRKWEEYGYLDYVPYSDYLNTLVRNGELDAATRDSVAAIGRKPANDSAATKKYVKQFTDYYESRGYTVVRLNAKMQTTTRVVSGGQQQLFAYKNTPLIVRLWKYFTHLISVENIHNIDKEIDIGKRGIKITLFDPVYQTYNEDGTIAHRKLALAIIGNGTRHKYLLYTDGQFPYIHQNLISINLGKSYSVRQGIDVFITMKDHQGSYVMSTVTFPTGITEESAYDLHSATFSQGSRNSLAFYQARFTDDYTNMSTVKGNPSKVGYSFMIGIIAVIASYLIGVPLGVIMARKKDKLVDKIGTIYIVFIIAVPSLAYIFLFKAIGGKLGLPTTFIMDSKSKLMYILPIVSLALPSIAGLMKWIRRYMIDQMNSDYVKFARSGGLSEGEIFNKHILKNAIIPIVHGIPASVAAAIVGAIITERVYVVPGAGNLLTEAINKYDNGVIVGVTLFYATLSVLSIILGDILMSLVDPRISFSSKAR